MGTSVSVCFKVQMGKRHSHFQKLWQRKTQAGNWVCGIWLQLSLAICFVKAGNMFIFYRNMSQTCLIILPINRKFTVSSFEWNENLCHIWSFISVCRNWSLHSALHNGSTLYVWLCHGSHHTAICHLCSPVHYWKWLINVILLGKLARRNSTYHSEMPTFTLGNGRICPCCDVNDSLLSTNKIMGDAATISVMLINQSLIHITLSN